MAMPAHSRVALAPADLPQLFQDYQALVYRTAYMLLGSREEAEDAVQEVFLSVYRSIRTYDPQKAAFSTWIYRVTLNYCHRRNWRLRWRRLPLMGDAGPSERSALEQVEDDQELLQVLALLPTDLRVLVVLRYGRQLPYEEIAGILRLPLGTV
jgi:RNA polymerase sigma-70 factor (ECF subfamily)